MNKKALFGDISVGLEFTIFLFLFLIIILFPSALINSIGASEGSHTGIITAVESNNNLLWDANLIYFKSSDQSTQEEIYCIPDNLLSEAKGVSSKKQIVTIDFENDMIFMKWECNGGISIVNNIK